MQIPVPPDLGQMKDTVMFGLTKKQIFFFFLGALVGLPVFFGGLETIGSSNSALLMLIVMFPFFMLGIYEKNGESADRILIYKLRKRRIVKVRQFVSKRQREEEIENRRKEVEILNEKYGKTFIYTGCKVAYKAYKVFRRARAKFERWFERKPYRQGKGRI